MVPVERNAGAKSNSRIWNIDNVTWLYIAQFNALTKAPKLQRNKIGGRIIRIQATANVPKLMASNNRDFLYYLNGFPRGKKTILFLLRKANNVKELHDEAMDDEDE